MSGFLAKWAALAALVLAALMGGFVYGHHEGSLAGAAALSAYKVAQATSANRAAEAAQAAQAQADAATLAQQQAALAEAQNALAARTADVETQAAKVSALQARLHAIPATDKSAASWLGPLPPSIKKALNPAPGGSL